MNLDIKYLVMDVDGTLTDGKVYIGNNGELFKAFNIKDGLGIHRILPSIGITPVIITGRVSESLKIRCLEIGVKYLYQGVSDKLSCLTEMLGTDSLSSVMYVGDDINDLECMTKVKESGGIVCCPKDSAFDVLEIADYISDLNGGEGAVRDCIEWYVRKIK